MCVRERERERQNPSRKSEKKREINEPNLKCSIYCDNRARVVCENLLLFFIFCVLCFAFCVVEQ